MDGVDLASLKAVVMRSRASASASAGLTPVAIERVLQRLPQRGSVDVRFAADTPARLKELVHRAEGGSGS